MDIILYIPFKPYIPIILSCNIEVFNCLLLVDIYYSKYILIDSSTYHMRWNSNQVGRFTGRIDIMNFVELCRKPAHKYVIIIILSVLQEKVLILLLPFILFGICFSILISAASVSNNVRVPPIKNGIYKH